MTIDMYQVDAFSSQLFKGNPAAVCILNEWLTDKQLGCIAAENNLSATAFLVNKEEYFELRWFTPEVEVMLCGHATIACALVLYDELGYTKNEILFETKSGRISVRKENKMFVLNFPKDEPVWVEEVPWQLIEGLNCSIVEVWKGNTDYMVVIQTQSEIEQLKLDLQVISTIEARGVIVTSIGDEVDFVSRFFAPQSGINEDQVTGSAHALLTPYWANKLNKTTFYARQLSKRGGNLKCRLLDDRVEVAGTAKLYLKGQIFIE
ncbi:PhzF family phenazine biosynthesis protein [Solitalea lacus]|uniref:PhzF family phenazine biosynthesis protein n=1 Tax=Solitalea lacus TaxID=2911172 RepID=UPI001EDA4D9E|nr:PhzF family phenazine biosynthesis protein [Solitalea lacus]UKJ08136.1 PhzF family phenazine biosynthesis protein [Solitalea lacus]